jgi:hypothetical protein
MGTVHEVFRLHTPHKSRALMEEYAGIAAIGDPRSARLALLEPRVLRPGEPPAAVHEVAAHARHLGRIGLRPTFLEPVIETQVNVLESLAAPHTPKRMVTHEPGEPTGTDLVQAVTLA